MAFLTPDNIRNEYGIEIKEKILPASKKPNRKLSGGTGKVQWITIHNTDDINEAYGTTDAEQYVRATFNGVMGGVTVHYYIDDDACWQELREDEVGYHAADGYYGPGNNTSLAIEIIMTGNHWEKDKIAEDRGAKLAAILLHRHGLGIDRLTTHNRWYPPKYCPAYILPHWDQFKETVKGYLYEIEHPHKPEPDPIPDPKPEENVLYRVQTGAFRVKAYAESYVKKIKEAGFNCFLVEDDPYYKVQVGAFKNYNYAVAQQRKIREAGFEAIVVKVNTDIPEIYTAADARDALKASVGQIELTDEQKAHLDINKDGVVNASDAREILKESVNK